MAYALSIGTKIIDLGWPWTAISLNFLGIFSLLRIFGRQQGLNEWRWTCIASDGIVSHWKYFSMYRLRWYCWALQSEGRFSEFRPTYQGCRALTFALARLFVTISHRLFLLSRLQCTVLSCCTTLWIKIRP